MTLWVPMQTGRTLWVPMQTGRDTWGTYADWFGTRGGPTQARGGLGL